MSGHYGFFILLAVLVFRVYRVDWDEVGLIICCSGSDMPMKANHACEGAISIEKTW